MAGNFSILASSLHPNLSVLNLALWTATFYGLSFYNPFGRRLSHALNGLRLLFRQAEQEVEDLQSSAKMNNKKTSKKRGIG